LQQIVLKCDDSSSEEDETESLYVTINDQNSLFLLNKSDDDEALDGFNSDGHLDTIPSIADEQTHYQNELNKILDYYNKLNFQNSIKTADTLITGESIDLNEHEEFDRAPLDNLCIDIGSNKHARYSCACHKCNIAVRLAIKSNKDLKKVISKLSKFAAKHKNTLSSVKLCVAKKVRFRINNETRWGSVFYY